VEIYVVYRFVIRALDNQLDSVQWIGIVVISVITVTFFYFAVRLLKTFHEWRFRKLTPVLQQDSQLRELYRWYEGWAVLLKMDIMFSVILILMGLFFFFSTIETVLNIVFLVIAFVWAFIGKIGIRMEDKKFVIFFFLFSVVEPGDIIFKLIQFTDGGVQYANLPLPQIYFAGILALIVRSLLMTCTIRLVAAFKTGLRDKVFDPEEEEEPAMNQIIEHDVKPYLTLTIKKLSPANIMALREAMKQQEMKDLKENELEGDRIEETKKENETGPTDEKSEIEQKIEEGEKIQNPEKET